MGLTHMFGWWQETCKCWCCKHENSTQKGPSPAGYWSQESIDVRRAHLDSNPEPSCCEATVLTTKPPFVTSLTYLCPKLLLKATPANKVCIGKIMKSLCSCTQVSPYTAQCKVSARVVLTVPQQTWGAVKQSSLRWWTQTSQPAKSHFREVSPVERDCDVILEVCL